MQQFRDLTEKVFFKVFLGFIALTFIMFGVNSFIIGSPNQWVAKVGDKKITQNKFISMMQKQTNFVNRDMSPTEAQSYINSRQFQQDVLNSMLNAKMYEIIGDHFAVVPSEEIILNEIVKDRNFFNENDKFDKANFQAFLRYNSIDEQDYIKRLENDTASKIAIDSIASLFPVNKKIAIQQEEAHRQIRIVDVINIDEKNISETVEPKEEEIQSYFDKNREKFVNPQYRQISYLSFNKNDLTKDIKITEKDIQNYYEKNINEFTEPQTRNSLHLLFDDENLANSFLTRFETEIKNNQNSNPKIVFSKLAKEIMSQDSESIKLDNISRDGFFPELTEVMFKLEVNQHSPIIKSQIGYHILLLTNINPPKQKALSEVKNDINSILTNKMQEQAIEQKMIAIDDNMLLTNSIEQTAQNFNLSYIKEPITINKDGLDLNNNSVEIVKEFEDLLTKSFELKENQFSQIFYNQKKDLYYIVKVEKIIPEKQKTLDQARVEIISKIKSQEISDKVKDLSEKVNKELQENPESFSKIAGKFGLKIEKDQKFPREFIINLQDGKQMPYKNAFLEEIFKLNLNQISDLINVGSNKYSIALLKQIEEKPLDSQEYQKVFNDTKIRLKNEIFEEFSKYLSKLYPVEINTKLTEADSN